MARDFSGNAADFLNIGDPSATDITGTALTISFWINADTVTGGVVQGCFMKSNFSAQQLQYGVGLNGTTLFAQIGDGTNIDDAGGTVVFSTATWYHIAMVKNGTGAGALKSYVNGTQDGSVTSNRSIAHFAVNVNFGRYADAGHAFDGRIAEPAIWAASLTADEISALAKGASPVMVHSANLKGHWPFWGSGSPEPDLSGNGNNATVNGTVPSANHAPVGRYAPSLLFDASSMEFGIPLRHFTPFRMPLGA